MFNLFSQSKVFSPRLTRWKVLQELFCEFFLTFWRETMNWFQAEHSRYSDKRFVTSFVIHVWTVLVSAFPQLMVMLLTKWLVRRPLTWKSSAGFFSLGLVRILLNSLLSCEKRDDRTNERHETRFSQTCPSRSSDPAVTPLLLHHWRKSLKEV